MKKITSWKTLSVGEGMLKTLSIIVQKFVGVKASTVRESMLSTLAIGFVQTVGGLFFFLVHNARRTEKLRLIPNARAVLWSSAFGIISTIITILGLWSFTLGADVAVNRFFATLSIVPGIFLDRLLFGNRLSGRQILGIVFFLAGAYSMLDFPNVNELIHLPLWAWVLLVMAILFAVNEALIRKASVQMNPWTNNFWAGLSTIIFSGCALLIIGAPLVQSGDATKLIWYGGILLGILVLAMHVFKLLAYVDPRATISLKKVVMHGTQLIASTIAGILIFGETISSGKIIGIGIFFIAIFLSDNEAWSFIRGFFSKSR